MEPSAFEGRMERRWGVGRGCCCTREGLCEGSGEPQNAICREKIWADGDCRRIPLTASCEDSGRDRSSLCWSR